MFSGRDKEYDTVDNCKLFISSLYVVDGLDELIGDVFTPQGVAVKLSWPPVCKASKVSE